VDVMPREKSIRSGWRCDSCGELVSDLQAGWVEWIAADDTKGRPKVSGLRLAHLRKTSPRSPEPHGCQYNPQDEFRKNRGIVEGLALDRFAGPGGLMLLLCMIAERELPVQELAHDAVSEGVIAPSISSGFYLQCEIWDVLKWANTKLQRKRATGERQNRWAVSH
jgi:hypothetical protein